MPLLSPACRDEKHLDCLRDMSHMPSVGARPICECPCHDAKRLPRVPKTPKASKEK